MNTYTDNVACLRLPVSFGAERRNMINGKHLDQDTLVHFNALLRTVYRHAESVSADSLVSLVRELQTKSIDDVNAMIHERIARAETLRAMLNDKHWPLDSNLRVRARLLIAYLDKHDDLIPDGLEQFGHLDDALMIELSWPRFAETVNDYQNFCAYRESISPEASVTDWQALQKRKSSSFRQSTQTHRYVQTSLMSTALFRVI
jgi:uncharacterized membrane protein YkvA (DUF1232 family)